MLSLQHFDVAIVGGGPAGAAAALAIRRLGDLSVAIVDNGHRPDRKIGESLQPEVRRLLAQLGVWEEFIAAGHGPSHGTCSAWGGPELQHSDFLFRPHGVGWHLDRSRFDEMLLEQAQKKGAALFCPSTLTRSHRTPEGWRLELRAPDQPDRELQASCVIDATGRRAAFARRQGAERIRFDDLIALYAYFDLDPAASLPDSLTLVEAVAEGWWYSARLPGQQLVAVFLTDAGEARARRLRDPQHWLDQAHSTTHTSARLEGATLIADPRVALAGSHRLDSAAGDGWLAVGDAAASFDPLSSRGIAKALDGGIRAAEAIQTGDFDSYRQQFADEFETYLEKKEEYYRMETRWPESPFWIRRQGKVTLSPDTPLEAAAPEQWSGLHMHMPKDDLALFGQLGRPGIPAHELASAFRNRSAANYSDGRIIQTMQYLVESGALAIT